MRISGRLIFPAGPAIMPYVRIVCLHLTRLWYSLPWKEAWQKLSRISDFPWLLSWQFILFFLRTSASVSEWSFPYPCSVLFLFSRVMLRTVSITFFLAPMQGLCMAVLHVLGNIFVEKWSEIDCHRLAAWRDSLTEFCAYPCTWTRHC